MKRYNGQGLRKPFKHPVWGRLCLFLLLLVFPIAWPAAYLWQARYDFLGELGELVEATFLPREDRDGR